MEHGRKLLGKILVATDLDTELTNGLPILEIAGNDRLLIENYISVVDYSDKEIAVKVQFGDIRILGDHMTLAKMSKSQLVVKGVFKCVRLENKEGR